MIGLKFGFCGLGQGANNIINTMIQQAPEFEYAIINNADVDLKACENIPESRRILLTQLTKGGAGKDITIGRQSVLQEREKISRKINDIFSDCDFIYIIGSFGGGFGSMASLTTSAIVAEDLQVPHGFICTIPRHNEDYIILQNAKNAMLYLNILHQKSKNLKSFFIIENEKLLNFVHNSSYDIGNQMIFERLYSGYKYCLRPSKKAIDVEDYRKVLLRKGNMMIAEIILNVNTEKFDTKILSLAFKDILQKDYSEDFIACNELHLAEAVAVFIEREKEFENEGVAIENLKETIKLETSSILRPVGIYEPRTEEEKNNWFKSIKKLIKSDTDSKLLKMTVIFAGLPFPYNVIDNLENQLITEKEKYITAQQQKRNTINNHYGIKEDDLLIVNRINHLTGEKEEEELIDLDIFNKLEKTQIDNSTLDWERFGA